MKTARRILGTSLVLASEIGLMGCSTSLPPPPATEDARITGDIRARFVKTGYLQDGYLIRVYSDDGVVQLFGTVDTQQELAEVESIVSTVPGVKSVRDDISVSNFRD